LRLLFPRSVPGRRPRSSLRRRGRCVRSRERVLRLLFPRSVPKSLIDRLPDRPAPSAHPAPAARGHVGVESRSGTVLAGRRCMRHDRFARFARGTARSVGHTSAFAAALAIVLVWAATGPYFHYSDTWQLVINTGTTVITFLMVFVIQQTQNRDSE